MTVADFLGACLEEREDPLTRCAITVRMRYVDRHMAVAKKRYGPKPLDDNPPWWARRMREAREAKGLSQNQVCAAIGCDQNSISRWENGKHRPELRWGRLLADLYEIDVEEITGKTEIERASVGKPPSVPELVARLTSAVERLEARLDEMEANPKPSRSGRS